MRAVISRGLVVQVDRSHVSLNVRFVLRRYTAEIAREHLASRLRVHSFEMTSQVLLVIEDTTADLK